MQRKLQNEHHILKFILKPLISANSRKNENAARKLDEEISKLQNIIANTFSELRELVKEYQNLLDNKNNFKMILNSLARNPNEEIKIFINKQIDELYNGKYDIESIKVKIDKKLFLIEHALIDLVTFENKKSLLLNGTKKYERFPDFYKTVQDERNELDNIYMSILKEKDDSQDDK